MRSAARSLLRSASSHRRTAAAFAGVSSWKNNLPRVSLSTTAPASGKMFCFQCEQTEKGTGCTTIGVCGKTPEVAALQDTLLHACKRISNYAHESAKLGSRDPEVDTFVKEALFSTLTNVDFDTGRFVDFLKRADEMKQKARATYEKASQKSLNLDDWKFDSAASVDQLVQDAKKYGVEARKSQFGADVAGLQELVTYGLKGMCAYADHAHVLGVEDSEVDAVIHEVLDHLSRDNPDANELLGLALKVGHTNIKVMGNLNHGAVTKYGHPEPTKVRTTGVKGKAIAVSGHDLRDLELILQQTEGKGINVYTHGELLPGHAYPELKKYKHLVANYGGAWQEQKLDFSLFPGPIVMTTNCIVEPRKSYKNRIFTRSVVGWPGCSHIAGDDMSDVVAMAESMPGFEKDEVERHTMTGFGHNAVLGVAGKVVELVQAGKLKHFFLIGGCDGSEGERSYFRDLALSTPKDTVVLTLACGKYRFNKRFEEFGDIEGIPRMLDIGQCNDAYSAIQIASALANAFGTDVNGLPLSFAVSWFEQKAVAVLLSLLALDIRNIRLGPKLPAFVTPAVLDILVQKFQIKPIGDPKQDLKDMLANN